MMNCTNSTVKPDPFSLPNVAHDILELWFGGTMSENYAKWFTKGEDQQNLDNFIREKFGETLKEAEQGKLEHWKSHPESHVALVVLIDQFSRHIYRNSDANQIKSNDKIALSASQDFLRKGWQSCVSVAKHVFVLMPFRHSNMKEQLQLVLSQIEDRQKIEEENFALLDRFKKTTIRKLCDAKDTDQEAPPGEREILAHHEFQADETELQNHKLYRIMYDFIQARYSDGKLRNAVVSLSGGVDSMVITKLLTIMRPIFGFNIIAIHIDYSNREESGLEADFVQKWCEKRDVIFRKRVIAEFKRGITDRELYEKETKRIRFETYQKVFDEFGITDVGILFGHHKGDEQENVLTNIMKGRETILSLSGMYEEGFIMGVKIWRPFLTSVNKSSIFAFAHKYGVPYTLDTTPRWSVRGKLRNQLDPLLKDIFGTGYLKNLSALGEDSTELKQITDSLIFKPYWQKIQRSEVGAWIPIAEHRLQPKLFWKETMRYLFHSMNTNTVRDKSMIHFMKRLRSTPPEEAVWVSLKKENPSLLYEDYLIIFRASYFPEISHFKNMTEILGNTTTIFGPWEVAVTLISDKTTNITTNITTNSTNITTNITTTTSTSITPKSSINPVFSMWDILSGSISYFIRDFIPNTSFFIDSGKRGKSFKGIPKHLSDFIPIVCGRKDRLPHGTLAKVTLTFNNNELKLELERLQYREDEKATLAAERQKVANFHLQSELQPQQPQQPQQKKQQQKNQRPTQQTHQNTEQPQQEEDLGNFFANF